MITFQDRLFCFTGTMSDLKRTQAEREARARGAMTTGIVSDSLDYLVIGSIPSIGWKFGDYGRKIQKARELIEAGSSRPILVPESEFMDALLETPTSNSGEIDTQVVVAKYDFLVAALNEIDLVEFERQLDILQGAGFHIRTSTTNLSLTSQLFGGDRVGFKIEVRLVRQLPLLWDVPATISQIAQAFEIVRGVDGKIHWFSKIEGSADFVRLIKEVPMRLRIE